MLLDRLKEKGLIHPPSWLPNNCQYLVQMGSVAYGVSDNNSDVDVYGWTIPPRDVIFPHVAGHINGFGKQKKGFEQWQEHHINDLESRKEYDFAVYGIVKYFNLVMQCNPNMLDSLFVPQRCILHCTQIAEMVREKRRLFLHKGAFHKFKGYAFSQQHKMKTKGHKYLKEVEDMEDNLGIPRNTTLEKARELFKENKCIEFERYVKLYEKMVEVGGRAERCKIYQFDTKFAYHLIRLVSECEQILTEHDLVIDEKGRREQMKAIRRGEWTVEQIDEYFEQKEKHLEDLYHSSSLPYKPDEEKIKELLLNCLEHHYGSLDSCIVREDQAVRALRDIAEIIEKNRGSF